jgi:hypothetical protein
LVAKFSCFQSARIVAMREFRSIAGSVPNSSIYHQNAKAGCTNYSNEDIISCSDIGDDIPMTIVYPIT